MSKEKRRVPKLRFPGFTEDWEQRKLGEVVTINPKTELPDEFKYVDLESVVGTNLLGFQVIKKENAPSRAQRLASYGDVFYQTVRPYQRNNYLFENVDKDMVFSTGYAQLRSKLDSYFLLTLVQNDNFVKVVLDNCTGTSYPAINGSELGKITVQIPSNEVEANQIGKVFRGIDKSITLHQRKLDNLKLKKKALLQKLFPKNGERYPELRFPGFTDAWEQRKLGDLLILLKDGSHGTHKNTDAGVYLLSAKNIKNGRINIMPDDRIISWDDYNVIHKNYELQIGDILLTIVGSIGETAIFNLKTKVTFQRSVAFLRPNSNLNNGFLYTLINTDRFQNQLQTKQVVSAQPGIYLGDLATIDITYPKNILEQEKIYNIFREIENSITLHQRKLDHLQLQKKALLQQMFV